MKAPDMYDVAFFHGYGTVYVSIDGFLVKANKTDFNTESYRERDHGDFWMIDGVVVCVCKGTPKGEAMRGLGQILEAMSEDKL